MTKATAISTFRISDADLKQDPTIHKAYEKYCEKRIEFGQVVKGFKETARALHAMLEGPLRAAGFLPDGKDWSLKDCDFEGILVQVWDEPRRSGKRKAEVPMKQLSLRPQQPKAAKAA
jgi:hypothetical protein